jgi:DNA invertase Pin-like site-specific DNA recombinase
MTPRPRKHAAKVRAVIYTRVSTERQAESGLSLDHQLTKCRALAVVNDYEVTEEITDAGVSAATLDRPGVDRVLALVRARKVEAILIAKLDRLTRSVKDLADLLKDLSQKHVALVSASESLNTETAGGRMVLNVMMSVAQWEREVIGERTRDAMAVKRQRGEQVSRIAPYGYKFSVLSAPDKDGKRTRRLIEVPREQKALRVMLDCVEADFGPEVIARELNRQGLTNRNGTPWQRQHVYGILRRHHQAPTT